MAYNWSDDEPIVPTIFDEWNWLNPNPFSFHMAVHDPRTTITIPDVELLSRRLNCHCLHVDLKRPRDYRRVMEIMFFGPIEEAELYLPLFDKSRE